LLFPRFGPPGNKRRVCLARSVELPRVYREGFISGPEGPDYRAKVHELHEEQREKFLYQEFVRYNHARRVRDWIVGKPNIALGYAQAAANQISELLSPLDRVVRVDFANICESHNLDDLNSEQEYPLYRPYGSSEEEATNVQYIALLLRTTDLIQITNQRAPTVLYKIINPKDPVSQIEWLKQNAVRHVRPQPKTDRFGDVSRDIQSDTIEVFADFNSPDGYFGLTSYLQYAGKELQKSFELAEKSKKSTPKKLSFPWRFIDDGHIKTEGFIPRKFGFELDQERILDLLTGRTLYNDSAVVLRELAQNSIDAVRLQAHEQQKDSHEVGKVDIRWNSKHLELEVIDNGTGMSQDVVEKHLLKVGSSRYQDEKFKEQHPEFSPISRFGIGVLSAFMVADTVEIITCSTEDKEAREIFLRSVHGRYLIRLLDKQKDPEAVQLYPHGTKFRLKLRTTATKVDVLAAVRRWIVIPRCNVTVTIDDGDPIRVGFQSPKQALEHLLAESMGDLIGKQKWRVAQRAGPGNLHRAISGVSA
jgi:molecular chaperone HtpG